MPISDAQKKARDKYDSEKMAYQTVKVPKQLLEDFRSAVKKRGDKVNTVLREAMIKYIGENKI